MENLVLFGLILVILGGCATAKVDQTKLTGRAQPNIVLISIDTLRADHLNCYGYTRPTSSTIDALAADGVMFLNAFAPSPKTTPSHMSLMTSLQPRVHRVQLWGKNKPGRRLDDSIPTLAEVLKKNGYVTGAFTGGSHMHASRGFDKGFDVYYHRNPLEDVLAWIEENRHKRFFLFYHTYAVHDPYLPPPPYNSMYDPEYRGSIIRSRAQLDRAGSWEKSHKLFWDSVNTEDSRDIAFLKALYDGAITHMDKEIVRPMLDMLKTNGLYSNTLIVFTSDHGEAFLEHNNILHEDLYTETLRVPLILVYPKSLPQNKKVSPLVRLIDIMPTIFELTGIETDIPMQGSSLLPAVRGETHSLDCYSTHMFMQSLRTDRYSHIRGSSLRTDRYSRIQGNYWKPVEEVYDRQKDPREKVNIINDRTVPLEALREKEAQIANGNNKLREKLQQSFGRPKIVTPDQETMEQLKALGYLE
jgi:arylsulfatase A-like enzyme